MERIFDKLHDGLDAALDWAHVGLWKLEDGIYRVRTGAAVRIDEIFTPVFPPDLSREDMIEEITAGYKVLFGYEAPMVMFNSMSDEGIRNLYVRVQEELVKDGR